VPAKAGPWTKKPKDTPIPLSPSPDDEEETVVPMAYKPQTVPKWAVPGAPETAPGTGSSSNSSVARVIYPQKDSKKAAETAATISAQQGPEYAT